MKTLHIKASPRLEGSHSTRIARVFLEAHQTHHPEAVLETVDVWKMTLPIFDQTAVEAKMAVMGRAGHTPAQETAWRTVTNTFNRIAAADRYVISTPIWNFGVPYPLKHLIDVIVQPGLAFAFDPARGFVGRLTQRKAVLIYSSAGDYTKGSPMEKNNFVEPYLERVLDFVGIELVGTISVAPTAAPPQAVEAVMQRAKDQARELAAAF